VRVEREESKTDALSFRMRERNCILTSNGSMSTLSTPLARDYQIVQCHLTRLVSEESSHAVPLKDCTVGRPWQMAIKAIPCILFGTFLLVTYTRHTNAHASLLRPPGSIDTDGAGTRLWHFVPRNFMMTPRTNPYKWVLNCELGRPNTSVLSS
jgi:hypothetical protein